MGKQLTVRLPDALVEFIDQQVEHGEATSGAAVVAAALDQQRRQEIADRDAAILARAAANGDDLDDLAAFACKDCAQPPTTVNLTLPPYASLIAEVQ